LLAWVRQTLVEPPITPATVTSLKESIHVAYEFLQEDATPLAALLPRPLFDRVVAGASGMGGAAPRNHAPGGEQHRLYRC
jgi:hypothetical protein